MRTLAALCALLLALAFADGVQAEVGPKKRVLVLHSYNKGLSWTEKITGGIEGVLLPAQASMGLQVDYEYMDTKRYTDAAYYEMLFRLFQHKYKNKRYDAIISADDNALQFLFKHRDEIFGTVPVIFCGVNFYTSDMLAGSTNYTGVVEAFDVRSNIELALDLFPQTREIVIVGDQTSSGLANHKAVERVMPEFRAKNLTFRFLEDGTLDEYQQIIGGLQQGSVVLSLLTNQDRTGATFTYEDGFDYYARGAKVPILSPWDFYLGRGALGGMMISGAQQGREAAQMALSVLEGVSVSEIPVHTESPNRYLFDYTQMVRLEVDEDRLPPGAEVINRRSLLEEFYGEYRVFIWLGLAVVALLLVTIAVLLVNIRRRVKAEQARSALVEELSATNRAYSRFFPYEYLRFLGRNNILEVRLGDQVHKEITILFTDIRGFTTMSERMTPEQTFRLINEYLSLMAPAVRENHGLIDKYIGDAIMALFPASAADAVRAAVQMQIRMRQFNERRRLAAAKFFETVPELQMGVGIHIGGLMVGVIGEAERMEGTVISDAVNVGSRLEGLCKQFGAAITISGAALEVCLNEAGEEAVHYRFLGRLRVQGKQEPVSVFEIYDADPPELFAHKSTTLERYNLGIKHYFEGHIETASAIFGQILAQNADDGAAAFYLAHCREVAAMPDAEGWDGVIRLATK